MKQRPLWNRINTIRPISDACDWLLIRDFNEIRHPAERDDHGTFDRARANEFETSITGFMNWKQFAGASPGQMESDLNTRGPALTKHWEIRPGWRGGRGPEQN